MFQTLFETFRQNLTRFSEQFNFAVTRDIEKTLTLCEQYACQCDDDYSDRDDAIQKNFYDGLQLIIQQLNVFEDAPAHLDETTIKKYELKLYTLLLEPIYPEKELNQLVFKRMPTTLDLDIGFGELDFDSTVMREETSLSDWSTEIPMFVDLPKNESIVTEELSLAAIFKIFQYHASSFHAYRGAIDDWEPLFRFDERYYPRTYSKTASKRLLKKEREHWVPYIAERLGDFLESDLGYWDVPSLFLNYLRSLEIHFSDEDLTSLKTRIQSVHTQTPERLSLKWLHYYRKLVEKRAETKPKSSFEEAQDIAVTEMIKKRSFSGEPHYVKYQAQVVPGFVITHCLIPNKKPHFWQRDKKRKRKLVSLMSDASIIQEFSENRIQILLESVSIKSFSLRKSKNWIKQLFTEADFLETHIQFLNKQLHKNGWLQSGSKKLSKHYQHLLLKQTQQQFQLLAQVLETMVSRFQRWADHHDQATFSTEKLKKHETQFQQEVERFQTYLARHEKRIRRFNRKLPKKLREHCRVEVVSTILSEDLSSSWELIHKLIAERETPPDSSKAPADDEIAPDSLKIQKEHFLTQLSEGRLLSETELTLLCANTAENEVQLQLERSEWHQQIDKYAVQLIAQIGSKKRLLDEDLNYLKQIYQYYHSISHERELKNLNRRIQLVITEQLQGESLKILRQSLESLMMSFESSKERINRFRQSLDREKRDRQKCAMSYDQQWKVILERESDPRVQRVFQEAYSVMLDHRWLKYQAGRKPLSELDALHDCMERSKRLDDFEHYREILELSVWSELEDRSAKQALLFFDKTAQRGSVSPKIVDRIKTRAWKRVMTPVVQF